MMINNFGKWEGKEFDGNVIKGGRQQGKTNRISSFPGGTDTPYLRIFVYVAMLSAIEKIRSNKQKESSSKKIRRIMSKEIECREKVSIVWK